MLVIKSKIWMREQAARLFSDERGVIAELLLIVGLVLLVAVILAALVPTFKSFVLTQIGTATNSISSTFGGL